MRYLPINLRNMYRTHAKNYKTSVKEEIIENLNKWREIMCSWVRKLTTVRKSTPPKLIYGFNTIPIKNPNKIFLTWARLVSTLYRKELIILRKYNKVGRINSTQFNAYSIATIIKIMCYW